MQRIVAALTAGLAPVAGQPGVTDVRVLGAIGVVQLDRDDPAAICSGVREAVAAAVG